MQIDYALILSAGKGTRMGEIGKKMPKPLWPIFDKRLLELQVDYCHWLGIKKIYINTYFLGEEIEKFIDENPKLRNVTILKEEPLLDSGGAVHNMAVRPEINYKGNVLLVNADQFLFFDKSYFNEALLKLNNSRAALFGITVDKDAKYNETVIENGILSSIRPSLQLADFVTYSGLGLLKLNGLKPVPGISRFFDTVTNFKEENISFIVPEKFEYWDFGTLDIYCKNIFKIQKELDQKKDSLMLAFLEKHKAIQKNNDRFINLAQKSIDVEHNGFFKENSVVGFGITEKIS